MMPRRRWLKTVLAAAAAVGSGHHATVRAAPADLKLPDDAPTQTFDFDSKGLDGWTTIAGQWAV